MPHVRKFHHHLFATRPYYIDYGAGCFGTFQTKTAALRAVAVMLDLESQVRS